MTIPTSILSRYRVSDEAELDVDRLLWEHPSRIRVLEELATEATDLFGEDARLSLGTEEKVIDIATFTTDPESETLSITILHGLRDQDLVRAAGAFEARCRDRLLAAEVFWNLVPALRRLTPEQIARILADHGRKDS